MYGLTRKDMIKNKCFGHVNRIPTNALVRKCDYGKRGRIRLKKTLKETIRKYIEYYLDFTQNQIQLCSKIYMVNFT
ncbi:hypothetical protein DVH24_012101 [Malus domestica]|uniref:Uncharacterized protein n=1 Tax=Malus domestica TaxID=3750 RepID=A0A498HSG5_MALDO|nr:hypothetical protein DVH24_012101 [Malus domestica]